MNILLAEDDEKLGELICYMLKKKGDYQVEWVKDGEEAFYYSTSSHYDVLILDWMKPTITGLDGYGLGLSIAKWIVDIHNGTIQVQSEIGKGSTFIVKIRFYLNIEKKA